MHSIRKVLKWLLGIAFLLSGANHFVMTPFYVSIMPPYLPWHLELVYLSGAIEMLAGAMLLVPRFEVWGAWTVIATAVAVFPANLHMAVNSAAFPQFNPVSLWLRLPMQFLIIGWAYWFTRASSQKLTTSR